MTTTLLFSNFHQYIATDNILSVSLIVVRSAENIVIRVINLGKKIFLLQTFFFLGSI